MLRRAIPILEEPVDVPAVKPHPGLGVSLLQELDQSPGERRVRRGAVVRGSQQLEADVAPERLGPSFHRLPGSGPGMACVQEHQQAGVVPPELDSVLDEFREVDRPVRCRFGRVGWHEIEVPGQLVGELAMADVRQDQGCSRPGRLLDGRLDRDLNLADRRVQEQPGRAAFERDADAFAWPRMVQQRVEAFSDPR